MLTERRGVRAACYHSTQLLQYVLECSHRKEKRGLSIWQHLEWLFQIQKVDASRCDLVRFIMPLMYREPCRAFSHYCCSLCVFTLAFFLLLALVAVRCIPPFCHLSMGSSFQPQQCCVVDVARVAVIGADLVSAWQNRCLCLLESFVRCYPILSSQDPVECYLASDKTFLFSSCVCMCVHASPENIHCGCLSTS